jgi:hypothetical protein
MLSVLIGALVVVDTGLFIAIQYVAMWTFTRESLCLVQALMGASCSVHFWSQVPAIVPHTGSSVVVQVEMFWTLAYKGPFGIDTFVRADRDIFLIFFAARPIGFTLVDVLACFFVVGQFEAFRAGALVTSVGILAIVAAGFLFFALVDVCEEGN